MNPAIHAATWPTFYRAMTSGSIDVEVDLIEGAILIAGLAAILLVLSFFLDRKGR